LARYLQAAVEANDLKAILQIEPVMARYEQMRINLDKGNAGPKPGEMDDTGSEAAKKLSEAEKQWDAKAVVDVTNEKRA